jgi:hypothetical protein
MAAKPPEGSDGLVSTLTTPVLNEDGEEAWAYKALDGHLRCPDCNSNAECEGVAFPELPWEGAVAVTDEVCHDCEVRLIDDPAGSPSEVIEAVQRSQRLFGEASVFAHIRCV